MLQPQVAPASSRQGRFHVSFAREKSEVAEAQALRYRVFHQELGAQIRSRSGLDEDGFDTHCDHLLVRDGKAGGEVVGTYRLLTSAAARRAGSFYSSTEFDLTPLRKELRHALELGRACVHPDYRTGAVINSLWSGILQHARRNRARYLFGCASIDLRVGLDAAAAIIARLQRDHAAPAHWRVQPRELFAMLPADVEPAATLPSLLKGYVRAGAYVCSAPVLDAHFATLDVLMLLPVENLRGRHARILSPQASMNVLATALSQLKRFALANRSQT